MKKIIGLAVILSLIMAGCSCTGTANESTETTATETTEESSSAAILVDEVSASVLENGFSDVQEGLVSTSVYEAVMWALENGIAKGYSDDTFRPDNACTRAEMCIFLWRMCGEEEPDDSTLYKQFSDYADMPNATSKKAISWAIENGITNGYSDGTFRPQDGCTRAEMCIFLWRVAGKEDPEDTSAYKEFTDYSENPNATASKAISWAVENGITKGYSDGTFRPQDECTRAEMCIFLQRLSSYIETAQEDETTTTEAEETTTAETETEEETTTASSSSSSGSSSGSSSSGSTTSSGTTSSTGSGSSSGSSSSSSGSSSSGSSSSSSGSSSSGSSSSSSGSSSSSSGSSSSGSTSSSSSSTTETTTTHTHTWVEQTEEVWIEDQAAYEEEVPASEYEIYWSCSDCGFLVAYNSDTRTVDDVLDDKIAHGDETGHDGWRKAYMYNGVIYSSHPTIYHEQEGHYETVKTGYLVCSGCGAVWY